MNWKATSSRCFNFVTRVAFHTICVLELTIKNKTVSKFRKKKSCLPPQNVKRRSYSRAMTAKKCTKKHYARAKLLFCLSKPIAFLPFSSPSPSSLLKLTTIGGKVTKMFNASSTIDQSVCFGSH